MQVFRPYRSALARYPLSRQGPLPPAVTSSSDSLSEVNTDAVSRMGLASWVAQRRGVDVNKRLCKAEAGGGRCHDRTCKCVHIASFVPTGMSTRSETFSTYLHPGRRSQAIRAARINLRSHRRLLPSRATQPRSPQNTVGNSESRSVYPTALLLTTTAQVAHAGRHGRHLPNRPRISLALHASGHVATVSSRPLLGQLYSMQMQTRCYVNARSMREKWCETTCDVWLGRGG